MRRFGLAVFLVLMVLAVTGCGKKSGLEGKVVDGKGKPVANLKIIAKQVQPIKGYEHFEATTDSDGTFSFGKLFPTSEYILFPWYEDWTEAPMRTLQYEANKLVARFNKDGWTTEEKMEVPSGPEGQTTLLTTPIVIQPCISSIEGKVMDEKGEPIPNVKIVAKQKHPVPGYEQFEEVTGSDGTFSFIKLFPTSEYVLFPLFDDWPLAPQRTLKYEANKLTARFNKEGWTTEDKMKVQSGPEGQTIMLASPMVIQPCISTVTGKLVDDRKRPMQGIKIVAKQVNPAPGYEQFEATTGADGLFSFTKLYPDSKYRLIPGWTFKTDGTWTVRTSSEQEILQASPSFRFILANGVVSNPRTGLQWKAGPDQYMSWHEASSWVRSLNRDGGGWRMPSTDELKGLYKRGSGSRNMTPLLGTTGWWVWSGETEGSYVRYFNFHYYTKNWTLRSQAYHSLRAFAVRSRSDG